MTTNPAPWPWGSTSPGTTLYRPRNGPANAPTADPTQPAGTYNGQPKYLNPGDAGAKPAWGPGSDYPGTGTQPPAASSTPLSSDPLTMLGQLYAQGFGQGGNPLPLSQPIPATVQAAAPAAAVPWGALIVVALIGAGVWYWYKHRKGASA